MVSAQTNTTVVGRLRIRSKASDPQLEQQRIRRMMHAATLHPVGLPESALLVVRRLTDPLPSRLRPGPFDTQADPAWQRAVTEELEKLSATAVRPAFGPVPSSAGAVLFLDRAEVLSSLALDWLAGTLTNQWWWRELLRERDAITALLREWIEAPQYVPGALELLSRRSGAVPFVQRLPRQAAAEMLQAVIRTHGIPSPVADPSQAAEAQPDLHRDGKPRAASAQGSAAEVAVEQRVSTDPAEPREQSRTIPPEGVGRHALDSQRSPWTPWVPEASTPVLSAVQKTLLVQALMLRRAPAVARTKVFQSALHQWQAEEEREAGPGTVPVERKPAAGYVPVSAPAKPAAPRQDDLNGHAVAGAGKDIRLAPLPVQPQSGDDAVPASPPPLTHAEDSDGSKSRSGAPSFHNQPGTAIPMASQVPPGVLPSGPPTEVPAKPQAEPAASVETDYGGIFFLLNMALYLSIYGDFSSPAEMGVELNIWDFLSLMAAQLTGGGIEGDPLWETLALLAGRAVSQSPGSRFAPPDEWRLPPHWLEPFPEAFEEQPLLRNGRLVSVHPAGFTVLDVPAEALEPVAPADRMRRWISWMAEYFRARLVRAMGREDAVSLLCGASARVTFTVTHVDVFYSLNRHPIEIRLAGLDRDPGWIPAAGRYLAFHFH